VIYFDRMSCQLCNDQSGKLHETKCNHHFHLSCLQKHWNENSTFFCPTCHSNIGLVLSEKKQAYIVFETSDKYQAVYSVNQYSYVKPTVKILSKWKRIDNRLTKREPSVLKQPIIVS